jgi:carbamoyl-phosphate synthase large subunit
MPKRTDLHKILIIGSGPIVIGQACEFDYSGTQACKALREEGYEVVLVNSNPATIMTDPELADRTYIEPLTVDILGKILERERPQALLPTVGGQTALNLAVGLTESGILGRLGVKLIGANDEAVKISEDRECFKRAMQQNGLEVPHSVSVTSIGEAETAARDLGYPLIVRPSFTLGGSGGGIAYNVEELKHVVRDGLERSPIHQVLVEESVIGWKEYELEVMRDLKDNVVIICSIENFDPMGVHTGDSITVAPSQTLSDRDYQHMRNAAIRVMRAVGVETGGSNIQFAVNPDDGRRVVIEMNPRVSRSSALASKATGFPIAKIAAKLAVGYALDEIPNDITRVSTSAFEPTIDYVVVKIPRWNFEKFPNSKPYLGVQMKSVGETMSIGRSFREALQKGIRSLEIGRCGFGADGQAPLQDENVQERLKHPTPARLFYVHHALSVGWSVDDVAALTGIDPWFLKQLQSILDEENAMRGRSLSDLSTEDMLRSKRAGFADAQIAHLTGADEDEVRKRRKRLGIRPVYKRVDTCGAEFEALTPYLYSSYEEECEAFPT